MSPPGTTAGLSTQIPNLKPQIPQISQIRGEGKTVSAQYNFFPDQSLRQITLNSLASVLCGICELAVGQYGATLPEKEGALTGDYANMRRRFFSEVVSAGLPTGPGPLDVVTEAHVIPLPEPAKRYLRFMGVMGRQRDWSFRLSYTGKFRTKPQQPWLRCEAWQYNSRLAPARIFHIRIRFGGLLSVVGRDTCRAEVAC